MKKIKFVQITFVILILGGPTLIFGQGQMPTTDEEWKSLTGYMYKENYAAANQLVKPMLDKTVKANPENEEAAILRYMHIICVAAQMNAKLYSKEEAIEIVKKYEGEFLIMPSRNIIPNDCNFNCIQIDDENENTLFVSSTNENGTKIFGFERYQIKSGISAEYLERNKGKLGVVGGKLESIKVEGMIFPRFRINVIEGILIIE